MTIERVPSPAALLVGVTGAVLDGADDDFARACSGFNLAGRHEPDVAVVATDAGDVAAAVRYAAAEGLTVSVNATGHGMVRTATGGLLVNTSGMQDLVIDPARRTARVGAGVKWREVVAAAAEHGLATLCGSSVDVGVVGYTMGGGLGPMARTFGLAADHVRRIELVTATGDVIEVDAEHEPELFWGLRGGKLDVGVVTEMEIDLMDAATYYGGGIYFPGDAAPVLLHAFATWAPALPESTTSSIALLRLPDMQMVPPPLRGQFVVHLRFVHLGDDDAGAELLAPMRALAPAIVDLVGPASCGEVASVHQDPEDALPAHDTSTMLGGLPPEAVDAILAQAGPGVDSPLLVAEVRCLGGALSRAPKIPNAASRGAAFTVEAIALYPPPVQAAVDAACTSLLAAIAPWSTGQALINFQGAAATDAELRGAWPADTRARLDALKQTWDPNGVFRFAYSA